MEPARFDPGGGLLHGPARIALTRCFEHQDSSAARAAERVDNDDFPLREFLQQHVRAAQAE